MRKRRGLCLASTATQTPLRMLLWLQWPTHQGVLTSHPCSLSMPNEQRCSTVNILPESGFSFRTSSVQLEGAPVREPSLFRERKCLSVHTNDSTSVRKMQEGKERCKNSMRLRVVAIPPRGSI